MMALTQIPQRQQVAGAKLTPMPDEVAAAMAWARDVGMRGVLGVDVMPRLPAPQDYLLLTPAAMRAWVDPLILGKSADDGLQALVDIGFLDVWLPEVSAMIGFGGGQWRHKDVWKHTIQVVKQAVPRLSVRWGALLHDIGKIKTRSRDAKGEVHFKGHSEVGARMFRKKIGARLGFEGELYDRIYFLILHHLRPGQYDGSWTDAAVRRFARDMGEGLKDLLDLGRADITTKHSEKRKRCLRQISELAARIRILQEQDAKAPVLPKGIGTAIIERFGIPPSKEVARIKDRLETAVAEGQLLPALSIDAYIDYIETHRASFGL